MTALLLFDFKSNQQVKEQGWNCYFGNGLGNLVPLNERYGQFHWTTLWTLIFINLANSNVRFSLFLCTFKTTIWSIRIRKDVILCSFS